MAEELINVNKCCHCVTYDWRKIWRSSAQPTLFEI